MKKIVTAAPPSPRERAASVEEAEVLPRRNVLRGALAAGCSLLVPASLLGCDRKGADSAGGEAAAPGAPGEAPAGGDTGRAPDAAAPEAPAAGTPQPAKVSQASVQYQHQPKGAQKCANCIQFIQPNACKVVEGEISPEGWCAIWVGQT
jgi:hypothetical protein